MKEQPDEYQRAIAEVVKIIDTYADEQMPGDEWHDAALRLKSRVMALLIQHVMDKRETPV